MTCSACGITWEANRGSLPSTICPRCQKNTGTRSPLADAPPMPAGEIQALLVQLKQIGWTPSES